MSRFELPPGTMIPRIRPVTLLLFAASWLIFEWLLFSALANQIGTFGAILFHIGKGGFGLLLLALVVRRVGAGLPRAMRSGQIVQSAGEFFAAMAGAVLIALPGLIPTLVGLALFAPSLRRRIAAHFIASRSNPNPRDIDLDPTQWRRDR